MKQIITLLSAIVLVINTAFAEQNFNQAANSDTGKTVRKELLPYSKSIDTVIVNTGLKEITVKLKENFAGQPFREENTALIVKEFNDRLNTDYPEYKVNVTVMNFPLNELIPNFYRADKNKIDKTRIPPVGEHFNIVNNISKPYSIINGLKEKNIVLWHSHGWYYSKQSGRWEWQRPRLFQSVEDRVPMSFTIPYLIPMLENAGANVYVPRERDVQVNEVVVDNEDKDFKVKGKKWETVSGKGFKLGRLPYYDNYNPFAGGTYKKVFCDNKGSASAVYTPQIPEKGEYAVYISYTTLENSCSDVLYSVKHAGGTTDFIINQKAGGSTWIYLGTFLFEKGKSSSVTISNKSGELNKVVTTDAVRLGGGMGIIARDSSLSGRPKFLEGARYWLQYAGMPDTLIFNLNKGRNDYNDDYQSRPEYANYLKGAPYGPTRDRNAKGLGVTVDASIAFHTDAGITNNDTTIGTLAIYSLMDIKDSTLFPDGTSRMANRDFADIVQTEIVQRVRNGFDAAWSRRDLRNAQYSESSRPNMPSILLEVLSHQNLLDMQFVHDAKFRFEVARAIYIGVLKYLASQRNESYVVQPLPVNSFSAVIEKGKNVQLKWKAVKDELEPTASPDGYLVYTRIDKGGFDNGVLVKDTFYIVKNIIPGKIYSFKISAVNKGGEGFPSEILSAGIGTNKKEVLIVNCFDRISAPGVVKTKTFSGFLSSLDAGVPDKFDYPLTGYQYDYNPESDFITNDAPGHGASSSIYETSLFAGNSFDYSFIHGKGIIEAGYSFSSVSDEAVESENINLNNYKIADFIFGKEKETHHPKKFEDSVKGTMYNLISPALMQKMISFNVNGGKAILSGCYIASELNKTTSDSMPKYFAKKYLGIKNFAGLVYTSGTLTSKNGMSFSFNNLPSKEIYQAEYVESMEPFENSKVLLTYKENSFTAAYLFNKQVIVAGFPFEVVKNEKESSSLMKMFLKALD